MQLISFRIIGNKLQVVILAGGKGTRLKPMTMTIPKPMMKINGVPFLEILIKLLKMKRISNVVMCVGYLSNVIEDYFQSGKNFNVEIKYSHEKDLLGTAGAIKNSENFLENEFIVINGDTFVDIDYTKLITFAQEKGKICTMCGYVNDQKNTEYVNNLLIDSKGNVSKYVKDEELSELNCIDIGVYYFQKKTLDFFENKKPLSLEFDVFPKLIAQNQVAGFATHEKFYDIGTLSRVKKFSEICKKLNKT